MDVERFQKELAELVKRHGGQLASPVEIYNAKRTPHQEYYVHPVPEMRGLHMFGAVRDVQPIRINISIDVEAPGDWQHAINYTPMHPIFTQEEQSKLFHAP